MPPQPASKKSLQTVATLGPLGTHSELSLREYSPHSQAVLCSTISEVFRRVADGKVEAGFVPVENLIQGPVTETLDALFHNKGRVYAAASVVRTIRNAVGVLAQGEWPRKVSTVVSHEQALRQCASGLEQLFPGAALAPMPSTASAIDSVLEGKRLDVAVVGPEITLREKGLRIVSENASDNPENKTRFLLLKRGEVKSAISHSVATPRFVTSVVIDPGRDRKGLLFEIIQILSVQYRVNLNSIHSRPDNRGGFVFHLNLEGHPKDDILTQALRALEDYCHQATGATAEVVIVGFYENWPFFSQPFDSIGIVGGLGRMGVWFTDFFASVGIEVFVSDVGSGLSLEELCQKTKVILLSVPMSRSGEIATQIAPLLSPGHLIVENCSIKACALNVLEQTVPQGVEVLGLHTMFGEKTASVRGENVIVTRTSKSGPLAQAFENLLYKHGAHIHHCAADEHDQVTAVVQSLLQLSILAIGDVVTRSLPRQELLKAFSTPNFRSMEQTLMRVIQQTGELTTDLQLLNPKASRIRHQLVESAFRLVFSLEEGDSSELENTLERLRGYFEDSRSTKLRS